MELTKGQVRQTARDDSELLNAQVLKAEGRKRFTKKGTVTNNSDGTIELLIEEYPDAGTSISINMAPPYGCTKAEIVGVFAFDGGEARFPIGLASFDENQATLRFFGKPVKGSRVLIHEGLKSIDLSHQLKH
ncbi:hypothetical protein QTO30_21080 [Yoonia sp. GPGPB17]|uniref:hypothetical protein n=1 Tax=Yoonia sp. GPGPB17 TaxID=3026147 RepID=UPI0030BFC055